MAIRKLTLHQLWPKKNESDLEEALRREEERMNKKLANTAPSGSMQIGGLQPKGAVFANVNPQPISPRKESSSYNRPPPVHATVQTSPRRISETTTLGVQYSPPKSSCTCGTICSAGTKFCPNCGKSANYGSQPHGSYGEIDTSSTLGKRDDSDREEALRREEERMNRKLSNTAPTGGSVVYGGLQPAHQPTTYQQPAHQPVKKFMPIVEDVVEEVVVPMRGMNVMTGPGTFCTYNVDENPNAAEDRPRIQIDQSDVYTFTPTPGRHPFSVECYIEGTDTIKFKLVTTHGATFVQKYTIPSAIGREKLKRIGNSIELNPF